MSRLIVLDTETTGLEVHQGHRVVELGCVELSARRPSGRQLHRYFNPGRAVDPEAMRVHGLTDEFLAAQPPFAAAAQEFLDFVAGAELIIHNAAFDVGFLDAELARLDPPVGGLAQLCRVTDTLAMARRLYPGQRNTLDALCRRLGVDNSSRQLHGALLDAQLLAEVYLGMTAGQVSLDLAPAPPPASVPGRDATQALAPGIVLRPDAQELAAHEAWLDALDAEGGAGSLWRRLAPAGQGGSG